VWTALGQAKAFAMETNIMDPSLLSMVMRNDGTTLDQELGADYWKKLEDVLGAALAGGLKGMKPSTVAALLQVKSLPMTEPMDIAVLKKAKEAGAEIIYLEEARLQQKLLDTWLDARAIKMMLDHWGEMQAQTRQLLAAYEAGNADEILALSFEEDQWLESGRTKAEFEQMKRELLLDRNASWVPKLEAMLDKGNGFVAVGAGHLVGPGSVLDLLQKKGYKVTRLP
jgi:uncharacterized protein